MTTKRRTIIISLTLILLIASVGIAAAMMIPTADRLLTQSLETLETITDGHAVLEIQANLPDQSMSGAVAMWGKLAMGPNGEPGLRLDVLTASEAEFVGITAVTNGTEFWLYYPPSNTVITGTAAEMADLLAAKLAEHEGERPHNEAIPFDPAQLPQTPAEAVAKLLEYVTAERRGSVTMAGVTAYQLRLVPIAEKLPEELRVAGGYLNLWLRASDQLPLGIEYTQGAFGSGKITASLAEINTGLDDAMFTFDIPAGAEVIKAVDLLAMAEAAYAAKAAEMATPADFVPLTPAYVPEGALLAETSTIGGAVVQRYALADGRSFFVAQGASMPLNPPAEATQEDAVTVRGAAGTLFSNEAGSRTLLSWSENGFVFLIGGDIVPEEALKVADSLR